MPSRPQTRETTYDGISDISAEAQLAVWFSDVPCGLDLSGYFPQGHTVPKFQPAKQFLRP